MKTAKLEAILFFQWPFSLSLHFADSLSAAGECRSYYKETKTRLLYFEMPL